jgi:hypothetical protein
MKDQFDINEQMRAILIDWLIEVHHKFGLKQETLFLTVNIIDRYISNKTIMRPRLQLLGVSALMIACKYDEICSPHIKDYVYITDNAYKSDEIFAMENEILKTINYEVVIPSPVSFFDIISLHYKFSPEQISFGSYLMEVFLLDTRMTKYLASLIACAAAYIVMKFFKIESYQEIYQFWNSNNNIVLLKDCAREMCYLVDNIDKSSLNAVKKKYAGEDRHKVSAITFGR